MAIPDELMPRTDKEEPKTKELKSETDNQNHIAYNLKNKTNFNWHFVATRILPIFLFVILITGVSIAAIPSWRNAFNKFIAKYSPKADEPSSCQNIEIPEYIQNYNANLPWISSSVNGENSPPADVVVLGKTVTFTIKNDRPVACYGDKNKVDGVNRIDFQGLPPFNKEGWPIKDGKVVIPSADPDIPDAIIDPNVQKLIDFDKITYPAFDTKDHFLSPSFTTTDYTINPIQINYNHDINSENNTADIKFDKWMKLIPKNTKFNEVSFVGSIWWTGRGHAGSDDYAPSHHQIGGTYMDCVKNGSGSSGNMLEIGNYTVTIHPYEAKNSWQTVRYRIGQEIKNPAYPPTSSFVLTDLRGYFYVTEDSSFKLTVDPEKNVVHMEAKKDSEGKIIYEGKTKLQFTTQKSDGSPISAMVTIKNVIDSEGKTIDSSKFFYHNSVKTDSTTGKGEIEVTSTKSGEFTFNTEASDSNGCTASVSTKIKFIGYDLNAEIKSENPDYSANSNDTNSKEKWPFVDGYLQVPVSGNNKTYRAKAEITIKDGDNPISGENINISFIDSNGNDITNDSTKLNIEGKNNSTNSDGKITIYLSSPQQQTVDGQSPELIKGKIKATYTKDGVNYDATSKFIDENGSGTENAGVEFVSNESKISIENICVSPSNEQEKIWEEIATNIGLAKANTERESWLVKLIDNTKDKIKTVMGLNKKAYSEDNTNQLCNDQLSKINENKILFVGNVTRLDLKIIIKNPNDILNQYKKIYLQFVQPVGAELNESSLEQEVKNIIGSDGNHISYGSWNDEGRTVKIDITNKIANDKENQESNIDSLIIEYSVNSDIKTDFDFKFELIGEQNTSSLNNYLIESAKAVSEATIATSKETKFKANKIENTPTTNIEKIARDVNNNGTIKELMSPLNEQGQFVEGIPSNYDPDYLKNNSYLDVYKDGDKWKEKIFPGDKIYYKIKFKNTSTNTINYAGPIWSIPNGAASWMCDDNNKCGNNYLTQKINNQNVISRVFEQIDSGKGVEETYWVQLNNEIPLDVKTINSWTAIGNIGYKEIYTAGKPFAQYATDTKDAWVNRDLFGNIQGQIEAADGNPLPRVLVGLVTNKAALPSFKNLYGNDKQIIKNYFTNADGKYSLEFDRQTDFLGNETYKYFNVAAHYYDSISSPRRMIKTSELNSSDILYFLSNEKQFPQKATDNVDIDLSQGKRDISYPVSDRNWQAFQQAVGGSVIWNNINSAFKVAKNVYNINVDEFTDDFSINFLSPSATPEKDLSYAKGNNIYLASNVWDSAYFTPKDRSADNEFHEFSHYLLGKIGIDQTSQDSNNVSKEDKVQLLVPMIDESAPRQCGIASTEMVYNWVINKGNPKQNTEYTVDKIPCSTGEDQYTWLVDNTSLPWTWNRIDSTDATQNKSYFDKIRTSINYGYPVIVYTDFYGMHIFVITGYDNEGNFYLNDPAPNRPNSFLLRQNQQEENTYDSVKDGQTVLAGGTKVTEQSLSEHFKYPAPLPPSTGESGGSVSGVGGATFMSEDYASKHPLRKENILNSEYYGYLNSKTNYSFIEGLSAFLALDIDYNIKGYTDWQYKLPRREVEYNLDVPQPSFAGFGDKYPGGVTSQTNESWVVASLIKQLTYGGSKNNSNTFWLHNVANDINISDDSLISVGNLLNKLKSKKVSDVYGMMLALQEDGIGNSNPVKYQASNGKEITIPDLKKDFLLYGFFKDNNLDEKGNWIYDTTGLEEIGKSANMAGFDATYYNIGVQTNTETITDTSITSSPYVELFTSNKSSEKNPFFIDIDRIKFGSQQKEHYDSRPNRQEIPPVAGSYLKLNYPGKDWTSVKVSVEFDSPNESLNYSYEYQNESGEYTYFTLPYSTYHTKATISAEGYNDTITIDSDDYWNTVGSELVYDYILSYTFGSNGVSQDNQTPTPTPTEITTPTLTTSDESGGTLTSTAAGETIVANVENYNDSKTATVYVNNQEIGNITTLGSNFGLNIPLPDNAPLGKNTIKIIDEQGKEISAIVNVTSNKYINKVSIIILLILVVFVVLLIRFYKKLYGSNNNLQSPPFNFKSPRY